MRPVFEILEHTADLGFRATGATLAGSPEALLDQGILVRSETRAGILEEIPEAYKDVDQRPQTPVS